MAGTADTKANSNRRKQKSIISQWQPLRDSAWDKAHGLRFVRRTHREASGIVRYGTGKELQDDEECGCVTCTPSRPSSHSPHRNSVVADARVSGANPVTTSVEYAAD
ncbi:uncharacterized protein TRUGW13939_02724 [Talaromyces rugulosus]|uniref:Uncharacterized protein n=1 Tax=Talaromyces rugulosus TaxID=121627 RepID=A0A7H8QNT0_TALRU|nr:uncharacterized protein TRUGW13939_02724 [Talaromyces rugulosus]QKX55627.1 hypothetical protein TRUGW13939_02724 [Talaromyces rugulosus]